MAQYDELISPLDIADSAFRALTNGPAPLAIDGRHIDGLPRRQIRLDELKRLLLRRSTPCSTRDAAWTELVRQARHSGPSWVVGAVGVAMPGLRRTTAHLARGYDGDTADIDAEVLTAFLAALRTVDITRRRIALRLCWAAYRGGAELRYANAAPPDRHGEPMTATTPPRPWGHPDFVLADAVAKNVISAADAELIACTRLEGASLAQLARELHITYKAAQMRRLRAESRLVDAITNDEVKSRMLPEAT